MKPIELKPTESSSLKRHHKKHIVAVPKSENPPKEFKIVSDLFLYSSLLFCLGLAVGLVIMVNHMKPQKVNYVDTKIENLSLGKVAPFK